MRDLFMAAAIAAGVCALSGPLLLPFLRNLKFGQQVRSDGPRTHLQKTGTPTMGGVMFIFSLSLGTLFITGFVTRVVVVLLAALSFGLIGFLDDFIKIVKKRPLGLKAREKIWGQLFCAGLFVLIAVVYLGRGTEVVIPVLEWSYQLGWAYVPFAMLVMVATTNTVNLTDGLDGLAAGVTVFVALAYLFITAAWNMQDMSVFCAALLGTCLGFLLFNIHPARLFMGDTGAMTLGGAVGALAVITKTELLLVVIGGVYVLEALSDIIQVAYFKMTGGKRFFRMSPLHHHFELLGWSEQRVVVLFWTASAVFAALGVALAI